MGITRRVSLEGFPSGTVVKNSPVNAGGVGDTGLIPELGRSPGGGNAPYSSIFAWEISWTEEPGGLQTTKESNHNLATIQQQYIVINTY